VAEDAKVAQSAAAAKAAELAEKKEHAERIKKEAKERYGGFIGNRWVQLVVAILTMICISNLQYSWTLFSTDVAEALGTALAPVQFSWSLFLMLESFLQPIGGFFIDRLGATPMFLAAGILVGIGWGCLGFCAVNWHSLALLYFFYALAGAGAAVIYGGSVSIATRWFPDKRGLASGLIAMGFGLGYIPFKPMFAKLIESTGSIVSGFWISGLIQGIVIIVCAFILHYTPEVADMMKAKNEARKRGEKKVIVLTEKDFTTAEVLRTPQFYLIWFMFIAISIGGLVVTANAKPFAKSLSWYSQPGGKEALSTAVTAYGFGNGLGRPFWGQVSDRIGRYKSLIIAFGLNAIFLFMVPYVGKTPVGFGVILTCVMFTWGELFSLFPALNADMFGSAYSTTNYGFIYSAKGFSSLLAGGFGAWVAEATGNNWTIVFLVAGAFSLFACIMTLVIQKVPKPKHKTAVTTTA
jgi:OFA family oxalate/formate antiporter-like MFS transporter